MRPEILFPLFAEVTTLKGVGAKVAPQIGKVAGPLVRDLLFLAPTGLVHRRATTARSGHGGRGGHPGRAHRPPYPPAQDRRPVEGAGFGPDRLRAPDLVPGRPASGTAGPRRRAARRQRQGRELQQRDPDPPPGRRQGGGRRRHPAGRDGLSLHRGAGAPHCAPSGAGGAEDRAGAARVAGPRLDRAQALARLARGAGDPAQPTDRGRPVAGLPAAPSPGL